LNQTIYNQESFLSATIIWLKQNLTVKNSKEVVKNNFTTNKQAKQTLIDATLKKDRKVSDKSWG